MQQRLPGHEPPPTSVRGSHVSGPQLSGPAGGFRQDVGGGQGLDLVGGGGLQPEQSTVRSLERRLRVTHKEA